MKIDPFEDVKGFESDDANIAHIARHDVSPEEAEFLAKLDLSEYFEPSDFERGRVFPSLKRTKRLISLRLPEQLLLQIKNKAINLIV